MKISEFYANLRELYPDSLSCPWDNDGLMCCPCGGTEVRRVLIALDASMAAVAYAVENGFDTLLTHHPMIFRPMKSVTDSDFVSKRLMASLKGGLSIISLHTRLDAGTGGVNDTLCDLLGLSDVRVFGDDENPALGRIGTTELSDAADFAERIKRATGAPIVNASVCRPVERVAVIGGSGGDLAPLAMSHGADTLVTGEAGYNDMLDFSEAGINIFTAGHYYTEFPVCETLRRLADNIAGAETEFFDTQPIITY